jgi:hypothetical protein
VTPNDILLIAQCSGIATENGCLVTPSLALLEKFAALVAAAERGAIVALGTDTASDWISLGGRDEAAAVSSFVADICKRSAT